LSIPDKNGVTLGQHYEQVEASTGIRPPELDLPPLPADMRTFWRSFLRLHRSRSAQQPIAFEAIVAYSTLTGHQFSPDEVDLICDLDQVHAEELNAWRT